MAERETTITCDVLVIGSGAGGLSTAVTARKMGANVFVIEKEPVFGGTTAYSGGVLWLPGNPQGSKRGLADTREAARTYLKNETGNFFQADAVETFLDNVPAMIDFFERETDVRFVTSEYPDYHPDVAGGAQNGRSLVAAPFDASKLGPELKRLKRPLRTITFMGMMFNSSNAELKHFFNATRSLPSALYVAKRLASHVLDLVKHRRGVNVTSGNALVARLAKSAFDLGIPIRTQTAAERLLVEGGAVRGVIAKGPEGTLRIEARRGVVLACGGYPHAPERIAKAYPHLARGGRHLSPTPEGNTGDGIRLAEDAGANEVEARFPNAAAWMPVSRVPLGGGRTGVFPHLVDRYKPGVIMVTRRGSRFTNEANSYHDVGAAMIEACDGEAETAAWLIADHLTIRKYGLGFAKPAPVPLALYTSSGYLLKGATLADLAAKAGIDPVGLTKTVRRYNTGAEQGLDPEYGRGTTAFNRFLGDADHGPNPNVGPVKQGPFYAVKVEMGDLGTFDGLLTDSVGRVVDRHGDIIPGLYANGNDRASIMGGNYPGAGITLGPMMTFGFVTGRHLATEAPDLKRAA